MRSRRCLGPGRPWGDAEASGRRVTCKAPSAHVVGGSGRSEASPTTTLQDTHSVEGKFSELIPNGFLRSSLSPALIPNYEHSPFGLGENGAFGRCGGILAPVTIFVALRAVSEEDVERRMRKRYPGAVAILVYLEESWRQNPASITPDRPLR